MIETRLSLRELVDRYARTRQHPFGALLVASSELTGTEFVLGHKTTDRVKRKTPPPESEAAPPTPDAIVFVLAKSVRNPFGDMLTIGRAENNDLVIHDKEVSKFHAYFREEKAGLRLIDARSTNGTFIDGHKLDAPGAIPSTLSRIRFGPTSEFVFIAREDVAGWLEAVASS